MVSKTKRRVMGSIFIFGIFLIGFVYVMPFGVNGAIRMLLARLGRKAQNKRSPAGVTRPTINTPEEV